MKKARILSIILIITLILLPIASFAQPNEDPFVYTALGDSIAYGTGAENHYGYTDMLAEHFDRTHKEVTFHKFAENGLKSSDLSEGLNILYALYLTDTLTPEGMYLYNTIASSDVITLSIGGNDYLGLIINYVENNEEDILNILDTDLTDEEKTEALYGLLTTFLGNIDGSIISSFNSNLDNIISKINLINQNDAPIYLNTIYNPVKSDNPLYPTMELLLEGFGETPGMNDVIRSKMICKNVKIIDVHEEFDQYNNPKKLLVHDVFMYNAQGELTGLDMEKGLHPTDRGYKFIFNLHKDQL